MTAGGPPTTEPTYEELMLYNRVLKRELDEARMRVKELEKLVDSYPTVGDMMRDRGY